MHSFKGCDYYSYQKEHKNSYLSVTPEAEFSRCLMVLHAASPEFFTITSSPLLKPWVNFLHNKPPGTTTHIIFEF